MMVLDPAYCGCGCEQGCSHNKHTLQPLHPLEDLLELDFHFQMVSVDFFAVRGMELRKVLDRYFNYLVVYKAPTLSLTGAICIMHTTFITSKAVKHMTTNEVIDFRVQEILTFLKDWGWRIRQQQVFPGTPQKKEHDILLLWSITRPNFVCEYPEA